MKVFIIGIIGFLSYSCKPSIESPKSIANEVTEIESKESSARHTAYPKGTKYKTQGFWEYLPKGYSEGKQFPLMIFYHGLGENGPGTEESLQKLLIHGPPMHISKNEWPLHNGDDFIVLSVQNDRKRCHEGEDMKAFLDWAVENYNVDKNRIYLTGLSCGGYGIWYYLRKYHTENKIAAVVPICGYGIEAVDETGCALASMPIWAFHGDADAVVNVEGSTKPIADLQKCMEGKDHNLKLTIYPGVNHDSWTQTFDMSEHDIYSWLLGFERNNG